MHSGDDTWSPKSAQRCPVRQNFHRSLPIAAASSVDPFVQSRDIATALGNASIAVRMHMHRSRCSGKVFEGSYPEQPHGSAVTRSPNLLLNFAVPLCHATRAPGLPPSTSFPHYRWSHRASLAFISQSDGFRGRATFSGTLSAALLTTAPLLRVNQRTVSFTQNRLGWSPKLSRAWML